MRLYGRTDNNQKAIVEALRGVGASVTLLHEVGDGCPDILVGFKGCNYALEVKGLKGKLTDDQEEWFRKWRGQKAVVRTVEEALQAIGCKPFMAGRRV